MMFTILTVIVGYFVLVADSTKSEENSDEASSMLNSNTSGVQPSDNGFLGLLILLGLTVGSLVLILYNYQRRGIDVTTPLKDKGNRFKLDQKWKEAGESFEAAAELFSKQRRCEHDAANNFAEAANCYRKLKQDFFTKKAVKCLETAANIYAEMGQFSIAGRHLEDAGDLAKRIGDQHSSIEAIRLYKKAADYWNGEDSPASAAGSLTKAANLMADIGMLNDAAREFEELGMSAQNHNLLVFGAKDHMFKSCLCVLCSNSSQCSEKADDLGRKCETFSNSDEQSLVKKLSAAVENQNISAFDTAVAEFERLNNLDDWMLRRLDDARKSASGESAQLM